MLTAPVHRAQRKANRMQNKSRGYQIKLDPIPDKGSKGSGEDEELHTQRIGLEMGECGTNKARTRPGAQQQRLVGIFAEQDRIHAARVGQFRCQRPAQR